MPLTLNDAATGQVYEVVYVTAISGVTLTVTRAREGTTAQNWNIGDFAFCAPTAGTLAPSQGNVANTFTVAPATASNHAMQFGQAIGRLLNVQVFTSSGTYTPTTGTSSIIVYAIGGGGGAGGVPATSSAQQARFTSGFSGQSITIGSGGFGGSAGANSGQAGGTTSFGSLLTAPGGPGSPGGVLISTGSNGIGIGGGSSGVGTGANIYASAGQVGGFGIISSSSVKGGAGGGNGMGGFGNDGAGAAQSPTVPATYGAGGSGVSSVASSAAAAGGQAKGGIIIIEEYA